MLGAWDHHPGIFVVLSLLLGIIVIVAVLCFFKTRKFKHEERMVLLRADRPVIFSFSEKLLRYVPWQFWASSGILVLLIVLFLICSSFSLKDPSATVLEIIKFVTGATIGALFGKNTGESQAGGKPKPIAGVPGT